MSQALPPGFGDWTGDRKYELRGTLGTGAMGVVLDGFDTQIERRVAIKVVRKPEPDDAEAVEAAARFKREAQAAGRLSHPGIVGVFDYGENDDTAWIVMEMVQGGTLKALMDRNERLPLRETVRIMGQVLAALAYAHGRGVIHRDIKPANVMLTEEGDAKLADFGIARIENSAMTQVGTLMGTPSYMAPEQLRGEALDARADIWAAGVMLYQLLTGEKPFAGGFSAVMHKVLNTEPAPPSALSSSVPAAMDAVVMKALAKRPDDRWPDARAFAAAIEAAALPGAVAPEAEDATRVITAAPRPAAAPAPVAAPAPARRPAWVLPVTGLGALAVLGAAGFLLVPRGEAPSPPVVTAQAPASPPAPSASPPVPNTQPVPAQSAPSQSVSPPGAPAQTPQAEPAPPPAVPTPSNAPPIPSTPAQPVTPQRPALQNAPDQPAQTAPSSSPSPVTPSPSREPSPILPPTAAPTSPALPSAIPAPQSPAATPQAQPEPAPRPSTPPLVQDAPANRPPAPVQPPVAAPTPGPQASLVPVPRPDWRAIAAAAVSAAPCGLVAPRVEENGLRLRGVLPRPDADALRQELARRNLPPGAAQLELGIFEGPFCTLVASLRPVLAAPGDAPEVTLDGSRPLRKGQMLRFGVRMPAWATHLHVAYATADGSIARLEPDALGAPGSRLRLGDPRPGFPGWEIDEPYGSDILLVVASEEPLFAPGAPAVEEQAAYAQGFAAAVQLARAAGRRIALTPVVVDTAAR
ncbi:protein kinase domain-containing protein [Roseomonas sp. WA12]